MKNKTNHYLERGAAHFLALIVFVLLVGAVGYVGYNTWQRQQANAGGEVTVGQASGADVRIQPLPKSEHLSIDTIDLKSSIPSISGKVNDCPSTCTVLWTTTPTDTASWAPVRDSPSGVSGSMFHSLGSVELGKTYSFKLMTVEDQQLGEVLDVTIPKPTLSVISLPNHSSYTWLDRNNMKWPVVGVEWKGSATSRDDPNVINCGCELALSLRPNMSDSRNALIENKMLQAHAANIELSPYVTNGIDSRSAASDSFVDPNTTVYASVKYKDGILASNILKVDVPPTTAPKLLLTTQPSRKNGTFSLKVERYTDVSKQASLVVERSTMPDATYVRGKYDSKQFNVGQYDINDSGNPGSTYYYRVRPATGNWRYSNTAWSQVLKVSIPAKYSPNIKAKMSSTNITSKNVGTITVEFGKTSEGLATKCESLIVSLPKLRTHTFSGSTKTIKLKYTADKISYTKAGENNTLYVPAGTHKNVQLTCFHLNESGGTQSEWTSKSIGLSTFTVKR